MTQMKKNGLETTAFITSTKKSVNIDFIFKTSTSLSELSIFSQCGDQDTDTINAQKNIIDLKKCNF